MPRSTWVYVADGRSFLKGSPEHLAYIGESYGAPAIIGDEGEFVSPIDRKVYSGRAGMREHNRKHDVVNNRDLAGLPYFHERKLPQPDPQQIRSAVIEAAKRKGYL